MPKGRDKQIAFRVSSEEYQWLNNEAQRLGVDPSKFIRSKLFPEEKLPRERHRPELAQLGAILAELGKLNDAIAESGLPKAKELHAQLEAMHAAVKDIAKS